MDNRIKIEVPAGDLMVLASVGQMFLELARQKARTPTNELFVAEADRQVKDSAAKQHKCECAGARDDSLDVTSVFAAPAVERTDYEIECMTGNLVGASLSNETLVYPVAPIHHEGNPFDVTPISTPGQVVPPAPPLPPSQAAAQLAVLQPAVSQVGLPVTQPIITSGVKLDGEGLPWDRRIHASTKTFRQSDNTWKLIRGVADTLVDQVKVELRTAMGQVQPAVSAPPTPPAPPVLTLVPPAPPAPPLPNMDNDKGWPDPPAGPVAAAVPPAPPVADPYSEFVQFCTGNQQSGRLAFEVIKSTCEKYGITQLPMLNARHDLIPTIRAELESLCKPS